MTLFGKPAASGTGTGANWDNADDLAGAIASAGSQEEVRFIAGNYVTPSGGFAADDVKLIGGFNAGVTTANPGTIAGRNLRDDISTIDGNSANRCFDVTANTGAVTIDGVKFLNGVITTGTGTCIDIGSATLTVRNFWAVGCQDTGSNGAQFRGDGATLTLENGVISGGGTGVYLRSASTGTIVCMTFYNNINTGYAAGEDGDALSAIHGSTTITVLNSIFDSQNDVFLTERSGGNIVMTYGSMNGQTWTGTGNNDEDPALVLPGSNNFLLKRSSPCINAANASGAPSVDRFGLARVYLPGTAISGAGSPPFGSRGAHQYSLGTSAPFHGIAA